VNLPLKRAIAGYAGVAAGQVVVGAGCDEVLALCAQLALGRGDRALVAKPTYQLYTVASRNAGAEVLALDPRDAEVRLVLRFTTARDVAWAPRGHEVAWEQLEVPNPPRARPPAAARRAPGVEIDPADVVALPEVMVGAAEILRVVTEPGDAVVVNPPVYPPFFATLAEVDRRVVDVPLIPDGTAFALDFDGLQSAFAAGARAYLFCNPHNPVGKVFSSQDVARVAMLAERYGVTVLADEIHAPLVLPGAKHTPFESVVAASGVSAITLTSASKGWNVAGPNAIQRRAPLTRVPTASTARQRKRAERTSGPDRSLATATSRHCCSRRRWGWCCWPRRRT